MTGVQTCALPISLYLLFPSHDRGHKFKIDKNGNPSFQSELWNNTKSVLCEREKIDIMIDDSEVYGKYFKTPYAYFKGR